MRIIRLASVILLLTLLVAPVWAEGPIERLDRWFVFGTNLAWFHNNYGADIGVNHAEGGWQPTFKADTCEKVFANLERMGCPVVRIWAFERQEGLMFTPDLTTDPKYPYHEVTGLDPVFMANCRIIMESAARHRVMVYWSLLNHLIREEQGGRHMRIITDAKVRASYLNNAAVPFVKEFGSHPAFFAVDVINEADGAVGGLDCLTGGMKPNLGCSWKQMRGFIKACVDAFHAAVPGIKVTCTSGWHEHKNVKAGRFSGLGLDFYDWHSYQDNPDLPNARDLGLDKPVIIGECGPKTEKPDPDFTSQARNWKAYISQATKGYAGLLTWSYGNPGAPTNFVMVNADHSWRAGAVLMFKATRGAPIPDAGPLLLTDRERKELVAVNAAVNPVIAAGRDDLVAAAGSPLRSRVIRLANDAWKYYPYLNPRYGVVSLDRTAETLLLLAAWELQTQAVAADKADYRRFVRLQEIGQRFLAGTNRAPALKNRDSVRRMMEFVEIDPSAPPAAWLTPFETPPADGASTTNSSSAGAP